MYGLTQYNPWENHINQAAMVDNERRFFKDPALPTPKQRFHGRAILPYNSEWPKQQCACTLVGRPPFGVCYSHRTSIASQTTRQSLSRGSTLTGCSHSSRASQRSGLSLVSGGSAGSVSSQ